MHKTRGLRQQWECHVYYTITHMLENKKAMDKTNFVSQLMVANAWQVSQKRS